MAHQRSKQFSSNELLNIRLILFFLFLYKQARKWRLEACIQRGVWSILAPWSYHLNTRQWLLGYRTSAKVTGDYIYEITEKSQHQRIKGTYSISFSKTKTNMTKIAPYFILLPIICSKENCKWWFRHCKHLCLRLGTLMLKVQTLNRHPSELPSLICC